MHSCLLCLVQLTTSACETHSVHIGMSYSPLLSKHLLLLLLLLLHLLPLPFWVVDWRPAVQPLLQCCTVWQGKILCIGGQHLSHAMHTAITSAGAYICLHSCLHSSIQIQQQSEHLQPAIIGFMPVGLTCNVVQHAYTFLAQASGMSYVL